MSGARRSGRGRVRSAISAGSDPREDLVPRKPPGDLVVSVAAGASEDLAVFAFAIPKPKLPARLSSAEREVAEMVLLGMSTAQVARKRRCSARTVANQLASVYRKLGVRSRFELAASAMRPPPLE